MPKNITANSGFSTTITGFPVPGEPVDIEPIENAFRVLLGNTLKTWNDLNAFRATAGVPNGIATLNGQGELAQPLQNGSVTNAKLADGAVSTAKIASLAVTTEKIADGAVSTAKIAPSVVTTEKIADGAVATSKLADKAVTTNKIADGTITIQKLSSAGQPGGVATLNGRGELAQPLPDGSVVTSKIADKAIAESKLADGAVTAAKIAAGAITEEKLRLQDSRGNYRIGPLAFRSDAEPIYSIDPSGNKTVTSYNYSTFIGTGMEPLRTLPGATGAIGGMRITKTELDDYSRITFIVGRNTDNGVGSFFAPIELSVYRKPDGQSYKLRPHLNVFGDAFFDGDARPVVSNIWSLGSQNSPWKNAYLTGGVIQTSDAREKTNIEPSDLGLNFVLRLKPVRYARRVSGYVEDGIETVKDEALGTEIQRPKMIPRPGVRPHYGLIAQDVKAVMDELGIDFGGFKLSDPNDPESRAALDYSEFIAPIIKAIQEVAEEVSALRSRLEILESKLKEGAHDAGA